MSEPDRPREAGRARRALRRLPLAGVLVGHTREDLIGDLIAGTVVAIMLVPQAMAYALLAGLPPQVGLYASLVPPVIYGLFGSSRYLAVGPVAIVSLLVADGVGRLAGSGTADSLELAVLLALMVGVIQLVMGLLRAGFVVTFLSHPVIAGFTAGAAIVIAVSQIGHLFGVAVPRFSHPHQTLGDLAGRLGEAVPQTVIIGAGSLIVLAVFRGPLGGWLRRARMPERWVIPLVKSGPLVIVAGGIIAVSAAGLQASGVAVVGEIPRGLPALRLPTVTLDSVADLVPIALVISFIGYIESYAVARALAGRNRERIRPDQELVALGVANLGGAVTGAYPVAGGFSRSAVMADAGARSGLASIVASLLIAGTVVALTPLLHDLPRAVLAAIIVMAVARLVDWRGFLRIWRYDRADGMVFLITFVSVLVISVEAAVLIGAAVAFILYLWRASRPHVAVVGRLPGTETYRNVLRHDTITHPAVVAVRVDESLTFATASALEETLAGIVAARPAVRFLVLECVAVNRIDATGLDALGEIDARLRDAGVELHLCELKGPVRDRLDASGFSADFGGHRMHASTYEAMQHLGASG